MTINIKNLGIILGLSGILLLSVILWANKQFSTTPELELTETYSNYGFSFKYPSGMKITEEGVLEKIPSENSGAISGKISPKGLYHVIAIVWVRRETFNADESISRFFDSMEKKGVRFVNKGSRGEMVHRGHKTTYQTYEAYANVKGPNHLYGVVSVWYCNQTKKMYSLQVIHDKRSVLPLFQEYLDLFVCHQ